MMENNFKYRVWDNDRKCFFNEDEVVLYPNGEISFFNADYDFADVLVEHCVGTCDKNEKPIYEGDIICKEFYDRPYSANAKSKMKNCLVYRCKNGQFAIKYKSDDYRYYSASCDNFLGNCELIGNIHENPNLMDNKDE